MIQELLASTLLTCAIGTPMLQPKNSLATTNKQVHGAYVLRDNMEPYFEELLNSYEPNTYHYVNFSDYFTFGNNLNMTFEANGNYLMGNINEWYLNVDCRDTYAASTLSLNVRVSDLAFTRNYLIDEEPLTYVDTLNEIIAYFNDSTITETLKYGTIYVYDYIILPKEAYNLFNCIYTPLGNQYNSTYTGYYNFITAPSSMNYISTIPLLTMVDNGMYNYISFSNTQILVSTGPFGVPNETRTDYTIYDDGAYKVTSKNIYINGMLPNYLYNKMSSFGTFSYVQPAPHDTTFQEFFFSIMDAPLYFITSMFSFELFGVELYVAFTGLITLAIVIVVIRKVF